MHAAQEVENQGKYDAEQDRGGQGKVEGEVAAPMHDVAGQTADGEPGPPEQHDQQSDRDQDRSQNDDRLAQVEHDLILTPPRGSNHGDNQHTFNQNIRMQNLWDGIEIMATVLTM